MKPYKLRPSFSFPLFKISKTEEEAIALYSIELIARLDI